MTEEYPVFHLTCITHRKDPIYAATIVGKPPMEDAWLAKAVERIFLPAMRMQIPEIVDINLPAEGVAHNLMLVSIRKSYPGQARKVMSAIWSLGQAMFTKCIVVVDEDCDVQDVAEVVLRVANNIDPERDIQFTLGPVDSLDHPSRLPNYGSQDGHRRHAQMEGRRIRASLAGDDRDGPRNQGQSGCYLGEAGAVAGFRNVRYAGRKRSGMILHDLFDWSNAGVGVAGSGADTACDQQATGAKKAADRSQRGDLADERRPIRFPNWEAWLGNSPSYSSLSVPKGGCCPSSGFDEPGFHEIARDLSDSCSTIPIN